MQHDISKASTNAEGLLRLKEILGDRKARPPIRGLLPVSASTWWALVQAGEVPQPLKIGRASFWHAKDVYGLIERLDRDGAIPTPTRARRGSARRQGVPKPESAAQVVPRTPACAPSAPAARGV